MIGLIKIKINKVLRGGTATLTLLLAVVSFPAHAEPLTIGRWCDRTVPNIRDFDRVITIRLSEQGKLESYSQFADGSELVQELEEMSGSVFSIRESAYGDKYRVSGNSGELQLLDNDGLIRTAARLENVPEPSDYIK